MENKRKSYLIWSIVAALLVLFCAFAGDLLASEDLKSLMGGLSDCFVLPGVILAGAGAIGWASTFGVYDMLSYGFSMVWNRLIHPRKKFPSYVEYKEKKDEKRDWNCELLIVGAVCLGVSFLCLIIYFFL